MRRVTVQMVNRMSGDKTMSKSKPILTFLEDAWLKQLYLELDHICFQFRLKLKKPVIEIRELKSQWGQWDPLLRTLSLSRHLIQAHTWQHVLGVFKHELAHLYVTEVLGGDSGHGADFQRACDALGLADEYRGSGLDLGEPLRTWQELSEVPEEEAVVLRKVEKLLAMTESSNENEAFLAMARVQELIGKYNLESTLTRKKNRYVSLVINHKKQKIDRLQRMIGGILTGYYFVDIVFSEMYDSQQNTSHKTMEILGTEQNVLMAEYVYGFLRQQTDSLWENYREVHSLKGAAPKMSFQVGVIAGFKKKLDLLERKSMAKPDRTHAHGRSLDLNSTAASGELIKFNDPGLKKFVNSRFPRLTSVTSGGRVVGEHYESGRAQGERIVVHSGLSKGSSAAPRALTSGQR